MDDLFLVFVPTMLVFGIGLVFAFRQVVDWGGERYQHKEYLIEEEIEKQRHQEGSGRGRFQGPTSLN
jgi:hypothetical protein